MIFWAGAALADEPLPLWGAGVEAVSVEAALGARWVLWAGEGAEPLRLDPLTFPGVAVAPLAVEGQLTAAWGGAILLRVEEGTAHAGSLEAAEARLGWTAPGVEGWLGRMDIPVTRDRSMEREALIFTVTPVLSRTTLPPHASGVSGQVTWPERASVWGGWVWPTATSDAPYRIARAALHPWGGLPESEETPTDRFQAQGVGSILSLDSPSIGRLAVRSADLEVRWRGLGGSGEWVWTQTPERTAQEWIGSVWSPLWRPPTGSGDLHAALRVERAEGLEAGEEVRWVQAARLAWRTAEQRLILYAEGYRSREVGTGAAAGEDVVVLGRGIERANDAVGVGVKARW